MKRPISKLCFPYQEIYKDRKKFSKQVFEVLRHYPTKVAEMRIAMIIPTKQMKVASSDLVNMGITVVSYTLKDIRDEEGYLKVVKTI